MAKSQSKYTPEMEARIRQASEDGPLNLETATQLASEEMFVKASITARGIVSKIRTMGLDYERQVRTSKDGSAVVRKDELVGQIEQAVSLPSGSLDSLEKAGKQALKSLLEAVSVDA